MLARAGRLLNCGREVLPGRGAVCAYRTGRRRVVTGSRKVAPGHQGRRGAAVNAPVGRVGRDGGVLSLAPKNAAQDTRVTVVVSYD